jgi:hypothetical protein
MGVVGLILTHKLTVKLVLSLIGSCSNVLTHIYTLPTDFESLFSLRLIPSLVRFSAAQRPLVTVWLDGGILKRTMADIESPGGHADPKISPTDVSKTSHFVNGAQTNDAASSHPKGSMTTGLPWQGDGNTTPNVVNETPEKIIASITAAAADRELAHQVWMNSSERDDEVSDALNRMMDWVNKLVSVLTVTDMVGRSDLVCPKLHGVHISRNPVGLLPNIIYLHILIYCLTLRLLGVPTTNHLDSQGRTRDYFDGHTIEPGARSFEHGNARGGAQTRCIR